MKNYKKCPSKLSYNWYAYGTISCTSLVFSHFYIIQGVQYFDILPSINALLSNKNHKRSLQELKKLNKNLNLKTIMLDFEIE